jgi:hypothetical protein
MRFAGFAARCTEICLSLHSAAIDTIQATRTWCVRYQTFQPISSQLLSIYEHALTYISYISPPFARGVGCGRLASVLC